MPGELIGVISDTHGLLRPEVTEILRDCRLIIHAGDIGGPIVLEELQAISPVVAVRGNVDRGDWTRGLPAWEVVEVDGLSLYVIHDLNDLDLDPATAGFSAVISGHSHRPGLEESGGVILLNPGSAGPRRFTLPVSMAVIEVIEGRLAPRLIELRLS